MFGEATCIMLTATIHPFLLDGIPLSLTSHVDTLSKKRSVMLVYHGISQHLPRVSAKNPLKNADQHGQQKHSKNKTSSFTRHPGTPGAIVDFFTPGPHLSAPKECPWYHCLPTTPGGYIGRFLQRCPTWCCVGWQCL